MNGRFRIVIAAVLVAAISGAGFAFAQSPGNKSGPDGPVHVYTNEDLEKYGAPPGSSQPTVVRPVEDWSLVREFLDRQYERLDADREYELLRRELEGEPEPPAQERMTGTLLLPPYAGLIGFPRARPYRTPPYHALPARRTPTRRSHPHGPPLREFMSRRETLHQRPDPTPRTGPSHSPE